MARAVEFRDINAFLVSLIMSLPLCGSRRLNAHVHSSMVTMPIATYGTSYSTSISTCTVSMEVLFILLISKKN